jgi:hypothetical protein
MYMDTTVTPAESFVTFAGLQANRRQELLSPY